MTASLSCEQRPTAALTLNQHRFSGAVWFKVGLRDFVADGFLGRRTSDSPQETSS